jgi:hypothetical protein
MIYMARVDPESQWEHLHATFTNAFQGQHLQSQIKDQLILQGRRSESWKADCRTTQDRKSTGGSIIRRVECNGQYDRRYKKQYNRQCNKQYDMQYSVFSWIVFIIFTITPINITLINNPFLL